MRILSMVVLASAFVSSAFAVETGFETGNTLTARLYRGQVAVRCISPGDQQTYFYSCENEDLSPAQTAKFVTSPGVDGDHVALSSTWENGKTVKKDADFDSISGKSKRAFNLWISTLLQRPLLDYGTNKVHYVLSKDGQTQSEGDFTATVDKAPPSHCGTLMIVETFENDCRNAFIMCQRYFQENPRCE